jgi:protein TonB
MEAEMFDAIGVSERTRKPWTVAVSFIGQIVMVGLAVIVPLIGTDGLPHRVSWVSVPEPPRAMRPRTAQGPAKPARIVPPQITPKGLVLPAAIPRKAGIIDDPELSPPSYGVVAGGIDGANGSSNGLIDSLVRPMPAAAPPPAPTVKPAAPAPLKRVQVGGKVEQGRLIFGPQPIYPPLARQARVSGTVRLEAVISRDGTILNLRAVSGHPLLIPAAVSAVQKWTFRPTYLNGEAVEVATQIDVNFMLQ